MRRIPFLLLLASAPARPALAQPVASPAAASSTTAARDTVFLTVGSPRVDARVFEPHAARVRVYAPDGRQVSEWDNELWVGDSAGRRVLRWSTTSRPVAGFPNRPMSRLLQTYDGITMAPLGYLSLSGTGSYVALTIDGNRMSGVRRRSLRAPVEEVDATIETPGWFIGASDLVPIAAGLRSGEVMVAPLWGPNLSAPEYRVFEVFGDTTLAFEGISVRARKVEERRRSDGSLTATWWLTLERPYMYYGEVPLPSGGVQRMTEVPIPE
jgi:hypothetical protein